MDLNNKNKTKYFKGQKLFITLSDNRNLEATFNRDNATRKSIILHNVSFVPSDGKSFEQLEFKLNEIHKISCLDLEVEESNNHTQQKEHISPLRDDPPACTSNGLGGVSPSGDDSPSCNSNEYGVFYDKTKNIVENHVFIDQIDNKFYEAVSCIQKENTVAVIGEGSAQARFSHLVILGIATQQAVFLFDIVNLGARIFKEHRSFLKRFLESRNVLKVVHDCRFLSDCLKRKHDVMLTNVFDTQACHLLVVKNHSGHPPLTGSFSDLVTEYLNLPGHMFDTKGTSLDLWRRRPLADGLAVRVAWKTILLRKLKPKLDDAYYSPFDKLCYTYLRSVRDMDDEMEVKMLMQLQERDGIPSDILADLNKSECSEN